MQENFLHLTVESCRLDHCAGKFPTLDGGELSLRTIEQDNVLHLTVQIRHLHHCAGKFPTLDCGELSLRTIVQENFLHFILVKLMLILSITGNPSSHSDNCQGQTRCGLEEVHVIHHEKVAMPPFSVKCCVAYLIPHSQV